MNNDKAKWDRIRAFYRANDLAIHRAGPDQWGVDPYAWDYEAGIVLTPIEHALWGDIRALSAILYPQYPVGRRFVDFGNPCAKVAIECDGARWHTDAAADAARQAEIEAAGWTVYRINGRECFTDTAMYEDAEGRPRVRLGEAYLWLKDIVERHGIRMWTRPARCGGIDEFLPGHFIQAARRAA